MSTPFVLWGLTNILKFPFLPSCQAGLVRLRGLLCMGDCSESDVVAHFGEDAGEAFFLLGELNK